MQDKRAFLGYQVYSAREDAQKDLPYVLKQLAQMGYDGVELAGFYGHSAKQIREMLDQTGLVCISSHVALALMDEDIFKVISDHVTLGCKYIAIPFLDQSCRPGSAGFAATIEKIYRYGALCRQAGLQLLYHNHDFEFVTLCEQYGLDFLYAAVAQDILCAQPDTCWIHYAGVDPCAYLKKYAGRCPVVHLKDYIGRRDGSQPYALLSKDGADDGTAAQQAAFCFKPVGYGVQDIPAVVDAALDAGAKWFIVEQDQSTERAPLEDAKLSRDYLRKLRI